MSKMLVCGPLILPVVLWGEAELKHLNCVSKSVATSCACKKRSYPPNAGCTYVELDLTGT